MGKLISSNLWVMIILPIILCSLMICLVGTSRASNISTDEDALLALKAHISNDPQNLIASNWSTATSVCRWMGITCGTRHRRVRAIVLRNMELTGTIPPQIGNLSFLVNFSLFNNSFHGHLPHQIVNLRRLKWVSLGFNLFNGIIPSWIGSLTQLQFFGLSSNNFEGGFPTSLCNLSKLYHLNLAANNLDGQIPDSIGNLQSLKLLSLRNNKLSGGVPIGIFNISSLQEIYISDNWLSGSIPTTILFKNITSSLRILSLGINNLTGYLPINMFAHLPFLEVLYLSRNSFSGPIPSTLFACKRLQNLVLSFNYFEGDLHSDFGNLTMLRQLYLGYNNFKGEIPESIGNLINLEELSILRNSISGNIPSSIGNLTRQRLLYLGENKLTGSIPPFELSNLTELDLGMNGFDGIIPSSIYNISALRVLLLVGNNLSGSLSPSFGLNLPNLEEIYIGGNKFHGPIPMSLSNASKLTQIDFVSNMFSGYIPDALGNLRNLQLLSLRYNQLSSQPFSSGLTLISSLASCKKLTILWLGNNPLNATLPISVGNLSSSLESFRIQSSGLTGTISMEIGNLSNLISLDLSGNELKGFIPTTIGKLRNLQALNLDLNQIQGPIPSELCGIQSLGFINLGGNELSEKIPSCLGNLGSLRSLNLQSNMLNSAIPSTLWTLKDIQEMNLSSNSLSGSLPLDIGNLKAVSLLGLSRNQFSGIIPASFGGLKSLTHLSLSDNRLEGSIPESFGDLISLEFLDLSNNDLSGEIHMSLEKLEYLRFFNVSFNQLQGEIPNGGPFTNLSAKSFLGNKELCGAPKFNVDPCKTSNHNHSKKTKIALVAIGTTVLALGIAIVILIWFWKRKTRLLDHQRQQPPLATWERISVHELQRATNKFDEVNLLGRGSFGSVYRGTLSNGISVAIKVYNLEFEGAFKSFNVECGILRQIRHRNLVKIISSCCTIDFKALVMVFMPNWSLEKWLYSDNYFLDIFQRLNIMMDVASALEYLHHGTTEPVVHCDLKPNNILLDEDMVAHVSDFGISKLVGEDQSFIQTVTLATVGYMAPEYGSEGVVSVKGDIYSFGILLMETFTRRKPIDEMFNEEMSMKRWIKELLPSGVTHLADPNLLSVDEQHFSTKTDCISSVMELALKCCADLPEERISSKDVHNALNKIKVQFLKDVQRP